MHTPDAVSQPTTIYEFLFRTTDDGILIVDSDLQITHINPAAAAMLSVTLEAVIGKTAQQAFRKNHALVNLMTRSGEQKLDVRLPRRRLAQGIADTMPDGRRVVLLHDITERRDIENRREMLSKTIAHDLRNPISAISGFADLISRFGDLNPNQEKYMHRIRQTTSKLHDMVKSLVDLAWIEAGMPLEHLPIRIHDLIQDTVSELSPLAKKHQIGIAVSVQRPLPVVMGDPVRLKLVIYNLVHNAILYSKPETNVAIHAWGDEREVYCSIGDQGIGIADNELEMIFDRMYRSRDEYVRNISGGGLGLTIARTIIKRHGGDIWASSNPEDGSVFTFLLPAVEL